MDYIKIEQSSSTIDNMRIKTAFEQAIIYFGKTSAGKKIFYSLFRKSIFLFYRSLAGLFGLFKTKSIT